MGRGGIAPPVTLMLESTHWQNRVAVTLSSLCTYDTATHAKQDSTSEVVVRNVLYNILIGKAEEKSLNWEIQTKMEE
jgi:hypothetical protein